MYVVGTGWRFVDHCFFGIVCNRAVSGILNGVLGVRTHVICGHPSRKSVDGMCRGGLKTILAEFIAMTRTTNHHVYLLKMALDLGDSMWWCFSCMGGVFVVVVKWCELIGT